MAIAIDLLVNLRNDQPMRYIVLDREKNLMLDRFDVDDYESSDAAYLAAKECAENYIRNPWVSPFFQHQKTLKAGYGTAQKLARLTLSFFNGHAYPFNCSNFAGLDRDHLEIAISLIRSYNRNGENDREFMNIANELRNLYGPDANKIEHCHESTKTDKW